MCRQSRSALRLEGKKKKGRKEIPDCIQFPFQMVEEACLYLYVWLPGDRPVTS